MKLKNNKGYVGIDVSIAVLILMILIPTITSAFYNVNSSKHNTQIKTECLNLIVNSLETAKTVGLENLDNTKFLEAAFGDIENNNDDYKQDYIMIKNLELLKQKQQHIK